MKILEVKKNDASQRLDKFLQKSLKSMPASLMYKLIRTKKIKVNRKRAEPKMMLAEGDTVQCFISEEFFSEEKDTGALFAVKPKLDIIYEDENILLINKPVGVLCHEDTDGNTNTLIFHIRRTLRRTGNMMRKASSRSLRRSATVLTETPRALSLRQKMRRRFGI